MQKFNVSEIFETIQGEGNYAGAFSLFIRFQYCNLTCSWCDTKYTWFADSGKYNEMSIAEIQERIEKTKASNIIFTGGEPTLYPLDKLIVANKKFHVETNGSIIPTEPIDTILHSGIRMVREAMDDNIIKSFNWVISPKLSNSRQQINELAIKYWAKKSFCIFKFVARNFDDLNEIDNFIQQFEIDKQKVYIALEGQTLESQLKPDMVDEMIRRGFNFSPRLHVLLWGNKREK